MQEAALLKTKQRKCYLYTRVSTSMQVEGYSLDAQKDKLRKYAAYEEMVIAGEYSDAAVIIGLKTLRLKKCQKHAAF